MARAASASRDARQAFRLGTRTRTGPVARSVSKDLRAGLRFHPAYDRRTGQPQHQIVPIDFRSFIHSYPSRQTEPGIRTVPKIIRSLEDLPRSTDPRVLVKRLRKPLDAQTTNGLHVMMIYKDPERGNERPRGLKDHPRLIL